MFLSPDDLRQILKGIAEKFEDLWIEREFLKDRLATDHDVPRPLLEAMLETAKKHPKWRKESAAQVAGEVREVLKKLTFETLVQDQDETPPTTGKPN